ncbi:twin-arginine translocation pathway signal [Nitratireductor indicus C115]|uniref:Twin-arginine translocation pathway signal n=1 Tax=Nitratireductor indicus C115 TaxID=1231190 RepID=K2NZ59_9HYPH|nr:ABC transporter substrate-binding protein [Nitratireductor indicus]EKF43154.1 twin-arginine translocation pathway signal [Nitratireductor indicus C115]SFQ53211.1 NitT/TauT family transport system substrate-binding protein [Nitratireductor indicus]
MQFKLRHVAAGAMFALLAGGVPALAQDKLQMQMNWTADSAHLGFAVAQAKGIYKDHDLDVTLTEGRGSAVAAQLVATGQTELGYADTGATLNVAAQGAPIRIIATIWKSGQFGIQYLADSGIKEPKDLIGKKLAVSPGSAMLPLIPVFLRANGIEESQVEIVSAAESAFIGLLTSKQVDAVSQTPENIVVPLAAQGIEAGNMYFYNNGVPIASLALVAREDKLQANPDVYKRFVEATALGWQEAMKDPEAAVDALLEIFPETAHSKENLLQSAKFSFASVCPGGSGDAIGVTDAETWEKMYSVMTSAMNLPGTKPVTDYYTLDYLPETPVTCP